MKRIAAAIAALAISIAAVLILGCSTNAVQESEGPSTDLQVQVQADVDPAFAPVPGDAVMMDRPDKSTPEDTTLRVILGDELIREKFNFVGDRKAAKWIMSASIRAGNYQITTAATKRDPADKTPAPAAEAVFISLFEPGKYVAGKSSPVWTGVILAKDDDYLQYPNAILKALLDSYGKSLVNQNMTVKSSYQHKVASEKAEK